ncbi:MULTISPECIES: S1 family peptidase [Vibrio]|uniref:S1 family peptidase n=1 Tax=Vibrio TaxID=662 RepID=UPI002075D43B|nr:MULTISPECIES: trypsin-like serine protease [Vibrio]USD34469.1 trypsin-like serine protease [Vibrio sp. SCSIO 43186]USD47540.1 trypsin-like serine protease [Vibrio sp. SCSIO 43145]USD71594.1 trypsin-like serine protease [Vibrio sp. SCSIO 43139]USD98498.1 serine protease [Vibrio coralliilyticus]
MRKLSILLPFVLASKSFAFDVNPYIVNGTTASISDYPSFASLYYDDGSQYGNYCGATVINSQYILTAAHCIYNDNSQNLHTWVVPQLTDQSQYPYGSYQSSRAKEFYFPDDYVDSEEQRWPNDIAIIKLESPLNTQDYQYLLNTTENNTYAQNNGSDSFKAIGHGLIEGNVSSDGTLLETSLELEDKSVCNSTDKQLCFDGAQSGSYKNSTCNGDSGGPVYWYDGSKYVQIGITSFGPTDCGDINEPATSVFTETYDYNSWINSVISGGQTPKYYISTDSSGTRSLVDNTAQSGGSGGGGSLGFLSFLFIGAALFRRKLTS